ncbi:MAG: nitrate- and nitrite sensing domain-containing protein, partial [Actinobacteria bacterium]|nr:nitrate- and nitrite sensing domain-containing protein [Actinomycetota bacterium]
MRLRRTSIRRRVFLLVLFPLLATIAIYSFAVAGQYRTAVGLANAGKVSGATIRPMSAALIALSSERSAAASYLVAPSSQTLTALRTQQAGTDKAAQVVRGVSRSGPVTANASALEKRAAAKFLSDLSALRALRGSVASRTIGSTAAINSYSGIMADGLGVAEQAIQETFISQSLATTARAEVKLYEAAMLAAEENDLYSADAATGGMPAADQIEFAQLAGLRSFLMADAVPQLNGEASGLMRAYVPESLSAALTSQEQLIIGSRPGAVKPPVPLSTWQQTAGSYARNLVVVL